MFSLNSFRIWLPLFLFVATSLLATDEFYDEVYFPSGQVRPQYVEVVMALRGYEPQDVVKFIKAAKQRFSGDNPMTPVPRILTQTDFNLLAEGTKQRAETIRRFLIDHAGKKTYLNKVIPKAVMDAILQRSGEGPLWERITPAIAAKARYLYGPDIIRRSDGKYVVLEDNTGFVGSPGDIGPAREVYEVMLPELYKKIGAINNPNNWYSDVQDRMFELSQPKIGHRDTDGALVIFGSPPYGDKEDMRIHDIWKARSAVLVTPNTKDRKILVEEDGAYVEFKGRFGKIYKKRIGFLWLNSEHAWADWHHPAIREKALLDHARALLEEDKLSKKDRQVIEAALVRDERGKLDISELEKAVKDSDFEDETSLRRKALIPGLLDAILSGKLQTNYTPAMEFIGDKMFHTYFDELTRFYLGTAPLLPGASSRRFVKLSAEGKLVKDQFNIEYALKSRMTSVIKVVDGRGGDGIYIGPKMTDAAWAALRLIIEKEPQRYLVQEFSHPSVVRVKGADDRIVDIRMLSFVDETGTIVSNTPWSRSNSRVDGDGKVNMSKNGTLMNVFVVPDPPEKSCEKEIAKRGTRP